MPSTVTNSAVLSFLLILCAAVSAGDKPPPYLNEPVLGLRLDARVKLDPLPEVVQSMCKRVPEDDSTTGRFWIFARAADAATTYYVVSGYSERKNPEPGQPRYVAIGRGNLYMVTGSKCSEDPADEMFEEPTETVPPTILQQLSRDLAARLLRAVGGPDNLRAEIKNQRIDFDALSPQLREAFRPYFAVATK